MAAIVIMQQPEWQRVMIQRDVWNIGTWSVGQDAQRSGPGHDSVLQVARGLQAVLVTSICSVDAGRC